jgi:sodium/potassium-transporting ATPase subunit alpha
MKYIKSLIANEAVVIHDGKQQLIPAMDIVVGDIVILITGDQIPADPRIMPAPPDLHFGCSLLTGASNKTTSKSNRRQRPLVKRGDRAHHDGQ